MDYSGLQSAVLSRLNLSTDDPLAPNASDLVNEAIHMVEIAHPAGWSYLRRTVTFDSVADQADYAFSDVCTTSTVAKVLSVKISSDSSWTTLETLAPDEAVQAFPSTTLTQIPVACWAEGETLSLYPTPDAVYNLSARVVIAEDDLSAPTETPICPSRFHGAIIAAALVIYYETLQDTARSQAAASRFDGWIGRMMTATREMGDMPRVRIRGDAW